MRIESIVYVVVEDWIVLREQVLANILESCVQFLGKSAFEVREIILAILR